MEKNLTTGSVFGNIVRFSLPYLLSYFLQTLYGMADLFIIGQYEGVASTTAVSIGSQVMHMLTVMIVGLAMGATVTIGQAVGARDRRGAAGYIGNTTTLFLALGMLGAWVSCFLTGYAGPSAIFQSMLFAYTWLWPDQMVLLFGIIPFKMKYLGWIELAFWAFSFLTGSFAIKVSLVLGLAGFLAFYGREVFDWCVDAVKDWKRRRDWENRNR